MDIGRVDIINALTINIKKLETYTKYLFQINGKLNISV